MKGETQIESANRPINVADQLSKSGTAVQIIDQPSPPRMLIQMLKIASTSRWVTAITANVTAGMRTVAVRSFETTVSASVTGSERQNRMLLSLRSAYRASSA